ncbi:hypothetical protein C0991_000213 [Blastosporella zonata]|nr:hypothetical protein C0991_000213 [Blastosporella zonata]
MAAQIENILSLDTQYLKSVFHPSAPWGKPKYHDSCVGIFALSRTIQRTVPTAPDDATCETIHASVEEQDLSEFPELEEVLERRPEVVSPLLPLEQEVKVMWPKLLCMFRPEALAGESYQIGDTNSERTIGVAPASNVRR